MTDTVETTSALTRRRTRPPRTAETVAASATTAPAGSAPASAGSALAPAGPTPTAARSTTAPSRSGNARGRSATAPNRSTTTLTRASAPTGATATPTGATATPTRATTTPARASNAPTRASNAPSRSATAQSRATTAPNRSTTAPSRAGNAPNESSPDRLVEVRGLVDLTDRYAFVRTDGYLPSPDDVAIPAHLVRSAGLRRGDLVTGAARTTNSKTSLARVDTINDHPLGQTPPNRPEFGRLTPLFPNERLLLETGPDHLTNRLIDLVMPIGKGQRALIAAPPKAGKTTVLAGIANAIAKNNPECRIMVVLVDERPEEVTDMERSIAGEVISSTFDRRPADHTTLAELAVERAKRLVELGEDVVILLDNLTRLGRAYNNATPASGRILTGGIDAAALYPPKRFLGAARNLEGGGSLTIIATALVETGSIGDSIIFEEYKSTGNAELKLDRRAAERRVFPAVDVLQSGTRHDELLMGSDEHAALTRLRRVLAGMEPQQALDVVVEQLRKTSSNAELLMQVLRSST